MSEPTPKNILGEQLRQEIAEIVRSVLREELAARSSAGDDGLMSVEQVSKFLNQSVAWTYRHWAQIGGRKIGPKSIKFDRNEVQKWLKSRKGM